MECCEASARVKATVVLERRNAAARRRNIRPPFLPVSHAMLFEIFPLALLLARNFLLTRRSEELVFWTQRLRYRRLVVQSLRLEKQVLQPGAARLFHVVDFHVAQIAACAFEQAGGILDGRAAGKAERNMLFTDADIKERPVP